MPAYHVRPCESHRSRSLITQVDDQKIGSFHLSQITPDGNRALALRQMAFALTVEERILELSRLGIVRALGTEVDGRSPMTLAVTTHQALSNSARTDLCGEPGAPPSLPRPTGRRRSSFHAGWREECEQCPSALSLAKFMNEINKSAESPR